jgi:hypothetical protein
MDNEVQTKFERMGARLKVTIVPVGAPLQSDRRRLGADEQTRPVAVDIRRDDGGEFFELRRRSNVDVQVLDVRPSDRHLLLMVREPDTEQARPVKSRFLCGHDERAWFVAAVPEAAHASNVQNAKDALKPPEVWAAIQNFGVSAKDRDRRRNEAFVRQGEWFFIPRRRLKVSEQLVLRREPIRRGSGKPHICQFVYRTGGQQVYVCPAYPNGLPASEYQALPQAERDRHGWRVMVRDARVFAKGAIRHPDHKTVWLDCWHQVVMNTETQARAMRHVAFLD